jgi:hypothetical protein
MRSDLLDMIEAAEAAIGFVEGQSRDAVADDEAAAPPATVEDVREPTSRTALPDDERPGHPGGAGAVGRAAHDRVIAGLT